MTLRVTPWVPGGMTVVGKVTESAAMLRGGAMLRADQIIDALQQAHACMALFDADAGLVWHSAGFTREFACWDALGTLHGRFLDELMRHARHSGEIHSIVDPHPLLTGGGDEPAGPQLLQLADGRRLQQTVRPLADGLVAVLFSDISPVHHALDILDDSVDAIAEGIALFDAEDRLVFCSEKFCASLDMLGASRSGCQSYDRLVTLLAAQATRGRDAEAAALWAGQWHEKDARSAPTGQSATTDVEIAPGRWMQFSRRPTGNGARVVVLSDISASKRQEQLLEEQSARLQDLLMQHQMEQAKLEEQGAQVVALAEELSLERRRAEDANRAKTAFMRTMSHELRTPLNSVLGFAEMLSSQPFGPLGAPQYADYAEDIRTSAAHMLQLINQILDLAKIENGRYELCRGPADVGRILRSAARMVAEAADKRQITLAAAIPTDSSAAEIDETAISQVALNLLSNAVKFSPEGGRIDIRVWEEPGMVCLRIRDHGQGIPAADLGRVMKPFEQSGDAGSQRRGTGLGLPISRALTELHGGLFSLASEPGRGVQVTVRLPLDPLNPLAPAAATGDDRLADDAGPAASDDATTTTAPAAP